MRNRFLILLCLCSFFMGVFAQVSGGQISRNAGKKKQSTQRIIKKSFSNKRISTPSTYVDNTPLVQGPIYPSRDDLFLSNTELPIKGPFDVSNPNVKYTVLQAPYFEGHVLERDMNRKQVYLKQISCRRNKIIDIDEWFDKNKIKEHQLGGGKNLHILTRGQNEKLIITNKQNNSYYVAYDLQKISKSPKTTNSNVISQEVYDVIIEGNIMYVAHAGNGFATEFGYQTGYISAINLITDEIIWTSQPLTNNSWEISLVGNSIIAGYGFTNEPDYLFVLDRFSGQPVQKIQLKTGPTYIIVKGQNVYVRTYSEDYVFAIQ